MNCKFYLWVKICLLLHGRKLGENWLWPDFFASCVNSFIKNQCEIRMQWLKSSSEIWRFICGEIQLSILEEFDIFLFHSDCFLCQYTCFFCHFHFNYTCVFDQTHITQRSVYFSTWLSRRSIWAKFLHKSKQKFYSFIKNL